MAPLLQAAGHVDTGVMGMWACPAPVGTGHTKGSIHQVCDQEIREQPRPDGVLGFAGRLAVQGLGRH